MSLIYVKMVGVDWHASISSNLKSSLWPVCLVGWFFRRKGSNDNVNDHYNKVKPWELGRCLVPIKQISLQTPLSCLGLHISFRHFLTWVLSYLARGLLFLPEGSIPSPKLSKKKKKALFLNSSEFRNSPTCKILQSSFMLKDLEAPKNEKV